MEGFSFAIKFSSQRNRIRILFTPFSLFIYLALVATFGKLNLGNETPHHNLPQPHYHSAPIVSSTHQIHPPYNMAHYVSNTHGSLDNAVHHANHYVVDHTAVPTNNSLQSHVQAWIEKKALAYQQLPPRTKAVVTYLLLSMFITFISFGIGNILVISLPLVFTLLFRKKYPTWWFNWNLNAARFAIRITSFALFLTPNFPSLEDSDDIKLELPDPNQKTLTRGLPLIKWLLILPHSLILIPLMLLCGLLNAMLYPYLLVTARYPKPLFNFVESLLRWILRVSAYSLLLCTDEYPKFSGKA